MKLNDRIYICEDCGNIVDRDFNASSNIKEEGIRILINKDTVGHTGINACGDDKVTESLYDSVVVCETGKRITNIV